MKAGLRRPLARPRSVRLCLVPTSRGRFGHGAARALALLRIGGGGATLRPSGRAPLNHATLAFAADQALGGGTGRAATRTRFARPGADLRGRDAARPCPPRAAACPRVASDRNTATSNLINRMCHSPLRVPRTLRI